MIDRGDIFLIPLNVRVIPEVSGVDAQRLTAHSPRLGNQLWVALVFRCADLICTVRVERSSF